MSEHGKDVLNKWVLGIAAAVCLAAGGAAITTWADVRQMKEAAASAVKAERIAKLESDLSAHDRIATAYKESTDQRITELVARVQSLERSREWQRNREQPR